MRSRLPVAALLALLPVACDIPNPRVIGDGPAVVGTDPADGDVDVDRAAGFRVFFDRSIHPGDVHRGTIRVQSGARSAFLTPWFDPVERALVVDQLGETPLAPSVRYRLNVEAIRDLDGARMAERHEVSFETGVSADGDPAVEPPAWAEVAPILRAACAAEGCHVAPAPALGLDLSSARGVRDTAIGVVAEQSRVGVQGAQTWHGAPSLDGLARIDVVGGVGRPARSYLVYKLLGDPHVAGAPMPPDEALPREQVALISDWIRAGAPTE